MSASNVEIIAFWSEHAAMLVAVLVAIAAKRLGGWMAPFLLAVMCGVLAETSLIYALVFPHPWIEAIR